MAAHNGIGVDDVADSASCGHCDTDSAAMVPENPSWIGVWNIYDAEFL